MEQKRRRGRPEKPYKSKVIAWRVRLEWVEELTKLVSNWLKSKEDEQS